MNIKKLAENINEKNKLRNLPILFSNMFIQNIFTYKKFTIVEFTYNIFSCGNVSIVSKFYKEFLEKTIQIINTINSIEEVISCNIKYIEIGNINNLNRVEALYAFGKRTNVYINDLAKRIYTIENISFSFDRNENLECMLKSIRGH